VTRIPWKPIAIGGTILVAQATEAHTEKITRLLNQLDPEK
jgi:hypothetical protein